MGKMARNFVNVHFQVQTLFALATLLLKVSVRKEGRSR